MIDKAELLRLHMIRMGKEKSRAHDEKQYGDPAKSVKFDSERNKPKGKTWSE